MYTYGIHVIVRQKLAQNCKVIIFQLKINLKSRIYKYTDIQYVYKYTVYNKNQKAYLIQLI